MKHSSETRKRGQQMLQIIGRACGRYCKEHNCELPRSYPKGRAQLLALPFADRKRYLDEVLKEDKRYAAEHREDYNCSLIYRTEDKELLGIFLLP